MSNLRDENELLKRFILDEMVLGGREAETEAGRRAYRDKQQIVGLIWEIVTNDGQINPWDHLYEEHS